MDAQTIIAKRIAHELRSGMLVNLGIGIPTLVANYVPSGMQIFFQSENGLIGTGPVPQEGRHGLGGDRLRRWPRHLAGDGTGRDGRAGSGGDRRRAQRARHSGHDADRVKRQLFNGARLTASNAE
jgi:hypothetical protein